MAEPPTLRIRAFRETFLNDKTRRTTGPLRWLQVPVKLHDLDWASIASTEGGPAALGVWLGLLELAGTLPARDGVLARADGRPFTPAEIAVQLRMQQPVVTKALDALRAIGWLQPSDRVAIGYRTDATGPRMEGRGVEEEGSGEERSDTATPTGARAARKPRAPSGPVQETLTWFAAEYERTQGTPYIIAAKDAVSLTRALKTFDVDTVRSRLLRGLTAPDEFLDRTDRGMALLLSQINKPALRGITPVAPAPRNGTLRSSLERIAEVGRQMQAEEGSHAHG